MLVRLLDTYGHPSSGPPAAIAASGEGAVVVSFYQVSEVEKAQEMTDPVLSQVISLPLSAHILVAFL